MLKLFVLLFCVVLKETYGGQAIQKAATKPSEFAGQEGCFDIGLKTVLSYGETKNAPGCSIHGCQENGDIIINSCGAIGVGEGFTLVKGNLDLPYPDCCDSVEPKKKN